MRSLSALTFVALIVALASPLAQGLLGEAEDIEMTRKEQLKIKGLVWRAVRHLNEDSDAAFLWKLDRVVSVRKQLVAGLNYAFDVLVVRSDCLKQDSDLLVGLHDCTVQRDSPRQLCTLDVYVDFEESGEQHFIRDCRPYQASEEAKDEEEERESEFGGDRRMSKIMEKTRRAVVLNSNDAPIWDLFSSFVDRYSKMYHTKREALRRFQTYKHNMRRVRMLQENEMGTAIYGETQFMDLTVEEFQQTYLPYKWEKPTYEVNQLDSFSPLFDVSDDLPSSVDWRKNGVVTDVKNQESCGSCWAFSVTGNIEGQWAIKKGKLVPLSEQELLDCDIVDQACNGGLPLNAYKEIIRIGGLEPESKYPYDAHKENCHLERSEFAAYINDSVQLPKDESKMAVWLFKNGPISIGINAFPLQFYRHGISHPWKVFCSPLMLNHGVLIVGYGVDGNKPFWIIKNSWGPNWGESGYYRLYRGTNVCGVHEMATSAIIS